MLPFPLRHRCRHVPNSAPLHERSYCIHDLRIRGKGVKSCDDCCCECCIGNDFPTLVRTLLGILVFDVVRILDCDRDSFNMNVTLVSRAQRGRNWA